MFIGLSPGLEDRVLTCLGGFAGVLQRLWRSCGCGAKQRVRPAFWVDTCVGFASGEHLAGCDQNLAYIALLYPVANQMLGATANQSCRSRQGSLRPYFANISDKGRQVSAKTKLGEAVRCD